MGLDAILPPEEGMAEVACAVCGSVVDCQNQYWDDCLQVNEAAQTGQCWGCHIPKHGEQGSNLGRATIAGALTYHANLTQELPLRPSRQSVIQGGSPRTWGAGAAA